MIVGNKIVNQCASKKYLCWNGDSFENESKGLLIKSICSMIASILNFNFFETLSPLSLGQAWDCIIAYLSFFLIDIMWVSFSSYNGFLCPRLWSSLLWKGHDLFHRSHEVKHHQHCIYTLAMTPFLTSWIIFLVLEYNKLCMAMLSASIVVLLCIFPSLYYLKFKIIKCELVIFHTKKHKTFTSALACLVSLKFRQGTRSPPWAWLQHLHWYAFDCYTFLLKFLAGFIFY